MVYDVICVLGVCAKVVLTQLDAPPTLNMLSRNYLTFSKQVSKGIKRAVSLLCHS